MKKKRKGLLIVGGVLLTLCICVTAVASLSSPSEKSETSITETSLNVEEDKGTEVAKSTVLPTATKTSTPTPENTATPTATYPPETETAIAVQFTQTAAIEYKNATATAIADIATSTRVAYEKKTTATAQAISRQKTLVASYAEIYWKELITYPDNHVGEKVVIRGRIFNINGDTQLQLYLAGTYEAVYIVMDKPFSDIYEDDSITVFGIVDGENCGTNAFGAEICQPLISDAWYTKP